MRRFVGAGAVVLVALAPLGFFIAAIWTAHSSQSEKLANTGLALLFGIPLIAVAAIAAFFALDDLDGAS